VHFNQQTLNGGAIERDWARTFPLIQVTMQISHFLIHTTCAWINTLHLLQSKV